MRTAVPAVLGSAVGLLIALVPVGYRSLTSVTYRNLRVVDPGVLYRSGQMTPRGFQRAVRELGVKTVISLRDTKDNAGQHDDRSEDDFCRANGVGFHRLPPADWTPVNGAAPGDRTVAEFLRVLDAPGTGRPVLVHCFAGIHRTGAHCAVYRMEYQGWPAEDAIAEMMTMGTVRTTFADNLLAYLRAYTPGRLRGNRAAIGGPPADR